MHTIIPPSQWKSRIETLGLSLGQAAKAAGVSHTSLYRGLKDGATANFEQKTMEAVTAVIVEREETMRRHLDEVA